MFKISAGTGVALVISAVSLFACPCFYDYDFSGTFLVDNEIVLIEFVVGQQSTVTIFTSSWDDGGFDPIMGLWDADGMRIMEQDDGLVTGSDISNGIVYDFGDWDNYITTTLDAGTYYMSVGQYNNYSNTVNLTDGFWFDNDPQFTKNQGIGNGDADYFNGANYPGQSNYRTGDWNIHVTDVCNAHLIPYSPVPEPGTVTLLLAGLGFAGAFWRKRTRLRY